MLIPHAEPPATLGTPPYFEISYVIMKRSLHGHDIRVERAEHVPQVQAMLACLSLPDKPVLVRSPGREGDVLERRHFAPIELAQTGRAKEYIFWEETGQVHPLY